MSDLLPCPFCGGEAHLYSDCCSELDETRWDIWHECVGHEGESGGYGQGYHPWFETPWYKTEAEAIAAWNTRAETDKMTEALNAAAGKWARADAENRELRELVRDMWFWSYCGHMDGENQEWQMKHISEVLDRMRKLGIEVDND